MSQTQKEAYPVQYHHPLVGRKAGIGPLQGTVERVVDSHQGQLVSLREYGPQRSVQLKTCEVLEWIYAGTYGEFVAYLAEIKKRLKEQGPGVIASFKTMGAVLQGENLLFASRLGEDKFETSNLVEPYFIVWNRQWKREIDDWMLAPTFHPCDCK